MLLQILQLGRLDYATALQLQKTIVELRKQGRTHDTLLLVEHPPVITLGRNSQQKNVVASPEFLAERGVEIFEIDRGGDVTFHGPGQLVGYPIIDLRQARAYPDGKRLGAVEYVRRLEEVLIRVSAEYGIGCERIPGLTGVWTQSSHPAKIAAIGVHVSRGVTSHGFALNVTTDLDHFKLIVPCGIADKPVTSVEKELAGSSPKPLDLGTVSNVVTRQFGNVFGAQVLWLESLDALLSGQSTLAGSPANQDAPNREPEDLKRMREELDGSTHDEISWA